jgi:hypothetical protein
MMPVKELDGRLLRSLESELEIVRKYAAKELGLARDLRAVQQLVNALQSEQCISVKARIVWALKQIRSPRAVMPLISELKFQDTYDEYCGERIAEYQAALECNFERDTEEYEEALAQGYLPEGEEEDYHRQREKDSDSRHDDENEQVQGNGFDISIDDYEYKQNAYEMAGPDDDHEKDRDEQELQGSEDTETTDDPSLAEEECNDAYEEREDDPLFLKCAGYIASPADALLSFDPSIFNDAFGRENRMIGRSVTKIIAHFKALLEALRDNDEVALANAVEAVGARLTGDVVPVNLFNLYYMPIFLCAKNRSPLIRTNTIKAMGKYKYPSAFIDLLVAALKDEDAVVKATAAGVLGIPGCVQAIEPLIQALKDRDERVYIEARDALVKIGTEVIVPIITALKNESNRELVRAECAREGDLGNKDQGVIEQTDWEEEIPL